MMQLSRNYLNRLAFISAALLLMGANGAHAQDSSAVAVAPQAVPPAALSAQQGADWRNEVGIFKIGLVRGWSSDMSRPALNRVENIFAKALGIPVKVVVFERFTSLMDAQADGRIDMAAYSARAFATVRLMCECVAALATPTTNSGEDGQIAILLGDTESTPSLDALGTAKLGRVSATNSVTTDMLRASAIIGGKEFTGKEDFWVDYADYSAAIKAYHNRDIDGLMVLAPTSNANMAGAGVKELNLLFQTDNGSALRQAAELWRSPYWPYGPIAVRSNLATEAKTIVLRTLEQMDVTEPLAHATLSESLTGPFRKTDLMGYANVSTSIRLLVSQNANRR